MRRRELVVAGTGALIAASLREPAIGETAATRLSGDPPAISRVQLIRCFGAWLRYLAYPPNRVSVVEPIRQRPGAPFQVSASVETASQQFCSNWATLQCDKSPRAAL